MGVTRAGRCRWPPRKRKSGGGIAMRKSIFRAVPVGLALAVLLGLAPLGTADAQGPPPPPTGVAAAAPGIPPPFIYGFFRDPLWPGPGQRFIAAECPIGLGFTIVHYCPGLPPVVDVPVPPAPVLPPDVLQCDPWFQYFPVCRRPELP
jgi:hypothetical protein